MSNSAMTRGNAQEMLAKIDAIKAAAQEKRDTEAEIELLASEIDADFDIALSMVIESGVLSGHHDDVRADVMDCFQGVRLARSEKEQYKAVAIESLRDNLEQ